MYPKYILSGELRSIDENASFLTLNGRQKWRLEKTSLAFVRYAMKPRTEEELVNWFLDQGGVDDLSEAQTWFFQLMSSPGMIVVSDDSDWAAFKNFEVIFKSKDKKNDYDVLGALVTFSSGGNSLYVTAKNLGLDKTSLDRLLDELDEGIESGDCSLRLGRRTVQRVSFP